MYCQHCMKNQERKGRFCVYCGKDLTAQNAPHQLPVGTRLQDRYVVGAAIGQGGFGITYVGMDMRIHKKIAIKEYFPKGLVDRRGGDTNISVTAGTEKVYFEKEKQRFLQEAEILAKFSGERNIVGISDNFEEHNTVYIVMDFIEGRRLDEYLTQQGTLTFEKLFTLFSRLMQSLSRVHSTGLIHRDISPQNIMVLPDETLILLDFGAAREYGESKETSLSVILKHGYSPSEQYMSHGRQGPWTDVYALCATMYRMLTTVMPPTAIERMASDTLKKPSELGASISPAEEEVLLHGLALDIENRIQSMEELHSEFRSAMEKGKAYRYRGKNPQKKKKSRAPLFLVPAALIAAAAVAFSGIGRTRPETQTAAAAAEQAVEPAAEETETLHGSDTPVKGNVPKGFTVEAYESPDDERTNLKEYYFVINNHSGQTAELNITCEAYNEDGEMLDSQEARSNPVGSEGKWIAKCSLTPEGEVDHVGYTLMSKATNLEDAADSFQITAEDTGNGVFLSGKNIGERKLDDPEAAVLFFDADGRAVGYQSVSIGGYRNGLNPGEEWSAMAACLRSYRKYEYTSFEYAVKATGNKSTDTGLLPSEQFTCEKTGKLYDGNCYVLVTNHTDKTAAVSLNAVAYDESGSPAYAGEGSLRALGPEETGMVQVRLSDGIPEDHITFRVSAGEVSSYYGRSAIKDMIVESRKEHKSILTAVSNYGSGAAEGVELTALFQNADDELVYAKYLSLNKIDLGSTVLQQINSPEEFDHADLYVTGYKNLDSQSGAVLSPPENEPSKLADVKYEKPKYETIMENMDHVWETQNEGDDDTPNYVFFMNETGTYGGYFRYTRAGNLYGRADTVTEGEGKTITSGDVTVTLHKYTIGTDEDNVVVYAAVDGDKVSAETPVGGPTVLWTEDMEEDHLEYLTETERARERAVAFAEFGYADY